MEKLDIQEAWNKVRVLDPKDDETMIVKKGVLKYHYLSDLLLDRCLTLEKSWDGVNELVLANNESMKLTQARIDELQEQVNKLKVNTYESDETKRMNAHRLLRSLGYTVFWPKNRKKLWEEKQKQNAQS